MWLTFNLSSVDLWCFRYAMLASVVSDMNLIHAPAEEEKRGPQPCLLALKSIFPCQSTRCSAAAVEFRACNSTSGSPLPWQSFTMYAQARGHPQRTACYWELFVCSENMCTFLSMQLQMSLMLPWKVECEAKEAMEMWINCLSVALKVSTFCQHWNYCVGFFTQVREEVLLVAWRTGLPAHSDLYCSQRAGSSGHGVVFFRSRFILPSLPVEFRHQIKSPRKCCDVKFSHRER